MLLGCMRVHVACSLHVTCNAEKANVLLAEADRIEDQKAKDHRSEGNGGSLAILEESSLDVFADNTAVLTVSGSGRNLGTIMSVNSSCCKVFGLSKLQMERRSVFTLIPPPLDDYLESSLMQYGAWRLAWQCVCCFVMPCQCVAIAADRRFCPCFAAVQSTPVRAAWSTSRASSLACTRTATCCRC